MGKSQIAKYALLNSLSAAVYVTVIGLFLPNSSKFFGQTDTVVTPVAVLLLLVVSVAVMAVLVFGRPVMWYLDGRKKEAVSLVFFTVGFLVLFTLIAFTMLLIVSKQM